ncbi:MAG: gas vesicle protein [Deltaproteobacteria bacterium]|nr:gas vesicle protein [Deltaproteobacteria bacterium]
MIMRFDEAIQQAKLVLHELTGLDISSVVGAEKEDEGWLVGVEVVEKRSIPDSMDILALYETRLDEDGNMREFKRLRMRKRIDTETEE